MTLSIGVADDALEVADRPARPSATGMLFARRWRVAGVAYVAVTAPLCAARFADTQGENDYLSAYLLVGVLYWLPGLILALMAASRTHPSERRLWRVWAVMFGVTTLLSLRGMALDPSELERLRPFAIPTTIVISLVFIIIDLVLLRARSGDRAVMVDALDLVVAVVAVGLPILCVVGETIVESPYSWFTISCSISIVSTVYCVGAVVLVRHRLPAQQRATVDFGILLGVIVLVDTVAHLVFGVHDFMLPAAPFLALHCVCLGTVALFFLWAGRDESVGLERFSWRLQVRGRPIVTLAVLASIPVTTVVVWTRRDTSWVMLAAVFAGLLLVVLTSLRVLVSARETDRLYRQVAEADDERRDLLNEVMQHADADRQRVAAHLHRQSAALYTAMASLTTMFARTDDGPPTGAGLAAERLKVDLARQSDELRRLAVAVRPIEPAPTTNGGHPLVAPIKAFVDRMYLDERRPEVTVRVDPAVDLEWTTEAIVLRIVQEAILNAWRHAGSTAIEVDIGIDEGALTIAVTDHGVGFDADAVGAGGNGMASLRAMARFLDAEVRWETAPLEGTTVSVMTNVEEPVAPRRPRLRLVTDS